MSCQAGEAAALAQWDRRRTEHSPKAGRAVIVTLAPHAAAGETMEAFCDEHVRAFTRPIVIGEFEQRTWVASRMTLVMDGASCWG